MRRWPRAAGSSICCRRSGRLRGLDPATQQPVHGIVGATVRAPCCMIADALTKVVMLAGEGAETLLRRYRANALFVLESGDVWITPDWQDTVRLAA
jgi:FAD:protein FMN transferase